MVAILLLLAAQVAQVQVGEPDRQPQLAARGANVALTFGSGKSIYFAESRDGGRTFGAPAALPLVGELSLGMHRGPRIAYTEDEVVVSAVVSEKGAGRDGDLLAWRSKDGGENWSGPARVNDIAGSAREGLHAMASGVKGALFAAWLDLRAKGTRVYGAASSDGTWCTNSGRCCA